MKNFLVMAVLAAFFFCPQNSFALSDADYKTFYAESSNFQEAENALNTVWKKLMQSASKSEKKMLREDQKYWITNKRDANAEYYHGNENLSKADAYAKVTQNRTAALETYLKQLVSKDKTITLKGKIGRGHNEAGGFWGLNTEHGFYVLVMYFEAPEQLDNTLSQMEEQEITVQVKGHLDSPYWFDSKSLKISPAQN